MGQTSGQAEGVVVADAPVPSGVVAGQTPAERAAAQITGIDPALVEQIAGLSKKQREAFFAGEPIRAPGFDVGRGSALLDPIAGGGTGIQLPSEGISETEVNAFRAAVDTSVKRAGLAARPIQAGATLQSQLGQRQSKLF